MVEWESFLDDVHGAGEPSLEAKRSSNREAILRFIDAFAPIDTFYARRFAAMQISKNDSLTIRDVLRDYDRRHECQLQEACFTSMLHLGVFLLDDQEVE